MSDYEVTIRRAVAADVPAIVAMLADDVLGAAREKPGDPAYAAAFERIDGDAGELLVVADEAGAVVGTAQLSITPGLSRLGALRGTIEAVRVHADSRGNRLGEKLCGYLVEQAAQAGCAMVQLTTDKSRTDAHRFYERLGFTASHIGMKLRLAD